MNLGLPDLVVVAVFFAAIVFVGVWTGRGAANTDDYFVGGRRMPGWAVGLSILGTCISSVTYVAYPGKAVVGDWQYLVQGLMLVPVWIAAGPAIARFYRRRVKTSVNEFLEDRFGPRVRVLSLVFLLASELARVGSITYLFSLVVHTITGFDIAPVILVIGGATILYSVLGGIKGVIWTDVIQTGLLFLGGIAAVAVAAFRVPGGLRGILSLAAAEHKLRLFDCSGGLTRDTFWVLALSGLVNYFYFLAGNQNQVQRYQCAATDREAVKASLLGSLLSVPVWALFLLVGTSLYALYHFHPDPRVAGFLAGGEGDKVFPHFIASGLPPGLAGLLLAGLAGAAMSSLDSSLNTASTLVVTDLYRRFIRPEAPDRTALAWAKLLTLGFGLIGIALALAMIRAGTFLDFYFKMVALIIGAIAGVFFLALIAPRAHERGILVGLAAGALVLAWGLASLSGRLPGALAFPWHPIMIGVLTTAVVAAVGYAASRVLPRA